MAEHKTKPSNEASTGAWQAYWESQGQDWRREPEIDQRRQAQLRSEESLADKKLSRADIEWLVGRSDQPINVAGSDLDNADLSELPLGHAVFDGAKVRDASFRRVQLDHASFRAAHMRRAILEGASLRKANLEGANLQEANLQEANLQEANLEGASLEKTNLTGANLMRALMVATVLSGANLEEAQLEGTDLRSVVGLTGIQLSRTITDKTTELPPNLAPEHQERPAGDPVRGHTSGLAILTTDDLRGTDQLDFSVDVEALCNVLTTQDLKPPISVGLFGEWGTGKSFFMQLMYERIKARTEGARAATSAGKPTLFCTDVRQIRFNAWHYVDANLWASLITHIFEELARPEDPEQVARKELETLTSKLRTSQTLLTETRSAETVAQNEKDAAQAKLNQVREERDSSLQALLSVTAPDLEGMASELNNLDEMNQLKQQLGLEADRSVNEVIQQAESLAGTVGKLRQMWREIRKAGWTALGIMVGVVVLALAAFAANAVLAQQPRFVAVLPFLAPILALAAALAKPFGTAWKTAALAVGVAADARGRQQAAKRLREERLKVEIASLTQREAELARAVDDSERNVRETQREIDNILTGRRVFRFIQERATSQDYRSFMGVIGLVRQDLERLSKLLEENRNARANGKSKPDPELPDIDRVILYIDDLDRCPAKQVVQVLEAVHLLLAFDLFVVVVGVDPRWLRTSLRRHFSTELAEGRSGSSPSDSVEQDWTAAPANYLEKIFQVPFALRPMRVEGFNRLVDHLFTERERVKPALDRKLQPSKMADSGLSRDAEAGVPPERDTGSPTEPPAQTGSRFAKPQSLANSKAPRERAAPRGYDQTPDQLKILNSEITFIKLLSTAIQTPRAAKRLVNTYRLVKATVLPHDLDTFVGTPQVPGEFQLVLLLLAIMIGFPAEAPQVFRELLARSVDLATYLPDAPEGVREALAPVLAQTVLSTEHGRVQAWVVAIARYSFHVSAEAAEPPNDIERADKDRDIPSNATHA